MSGFLGCVGLVWRFRGWIGLDDFGASLKKLDTEETVSFRLALDSFDGCTELAEDLDGGLIDGAAGLRDRTSICGKGSVWTWVSVEGLYLQVIRTWSVWKAFEVFVCLLSKCTLYLQIPVQEMVCPEGIWRH
ncbi:predicted protein [Nematostella vectensis]|uniref:Uncharacterized protein n=1 Tax=Nematostella vectensis TaxID=45351 RepID=A7S6R0_NEMVE|nr:predicted protein [Nematostella vectensis]|eukprot:XP_001632634.1 predicted protein [Nematostella vectensis]